MGKLKYRDEIKSIGSGYIHLVTNPPPTRNAGDIHRSPARPSDIQRNRHLRDATGRNFVPNESAVGFVVISRGNHDNFRRYAEPPSGRLCGEGGIQRNSHPTGRNSARSPISSRFMAECRISQIGGRLCRIPRKSCEISDVHGSAARQVLRRRGGQGDFARSAAIQRNIHLLGMGGRNFEPHYSAADRVEISPWGP